MTDAKTEKLKLPPEDVAAPKKKHIGVNAFASTFGTSLVIQACTVLQGVLVARLLGPVGRGEYAAVILWPMLFGSFGVAGIYIAIARISAKVDDYASIVRSGIVFAFITSVISSAACYVALPWLIPQTESHLIPLARLFILIIPLVRLIMNLNAIDQGRGDFKQFNFIRAIINPVYAALLLGLWLLHIKEVYWCMVALLLGNLAAVLIWLFTAVQRYSFIGKLYSLKDILKQSIPFSIAGIFQVLYLQVDKALMLWLLGTKNLGLYMVALSASAVAGSITASAGMVSFAMAAQTGQGDGFERLAKTFRISVLLWVIIGSILALMMSTLLPFIYGSEFIDAVGPARLLIVGSAIAGLANMLEQSIRGQGKAFIGLEGRLAGLVVVILLAILLAKTSGALGVCYAYIAGQFLCLVIIIWRINQHYKVKKMSDYIPHTNDMKYLINLFLQRLKAIRARVIHK